MAQKLQNSFQKIGIITKSNISESISFLKKVVTLLKKNKREIYFDQHVALALKLKEKGYSKEMLLQRCDVIFVMGGDGTILKTASYTPLKKMPIFGINIGNLGFLTETTPEAFSEDLQKLFQGHYSLDKRSLLRVTHYRDGKKMQTFLALNDAVINQGSFARLIEMDVEINKQEVVTFKADGLIISSPTGSTAHSLSAGGPIVHPSLTAFILTPICPATLSIRPIVVPSDRQISIDLTTQRRESQDVGLTIDGQTTIQLQYGDRIKIRKSRRSFYLIRLKDNKNYYAMLRTKLHWGAHHGDFQLERKGR